MEASPKPSQADAGDEIVHRILAAIAENEQCDPLDLPPLSENIDPDALGEVIQGTGVTGISFSYYGYHIWIGSEGTVSVSPQ